MFSCSVFRNRFVDGICVGVHQRSDIWEISKLKGLHTCQNSFVLQCHRQIDLNLITEVMLTITKRELSTSVATIQGVVERDYGHKVSYWKVWMVIQKILELLFGTHEESFQNLSRILLAIRYPNPRTIVTLDHKIVDGNKAIFKRAFRAFSASIDRL